MNTNQKDKESKKSDKQVELSEFIRIQGVGKRNEYAALTLFSKKGAMTINDWNSLFKQNKLI